jgi:hypothetical protein
MVAIFYIKCVIAYVIAMVSVGQFLRFAFIETGVMASSRPSDAVCALGVSIITLAFAGIILPYRGKP